MRAWVLLPIVLLGCEPISTEGGLFEPVRASIPTAPAAPAAVPEDSFNFDDDVREADEEGTVEPNPDGEPVNIGAALGMSLPEPAPEPEPVAEPEPLAGVVAEVPAWNPSQPIVGNWGVAVLDTSPNAQPPRATLRFADGRPVAVQPGDLLSEYGVVVMAIGRDAVQLATVTAEGDHAKIQSQVIPVMTSGPVLLSVQ